MKYFAPFLLILGCSIALFAQVLPPPPVAIPTPYAETVEAWQNFAPEMEQISIEVPGAMTAGFAKSPVAPIVGGEASLPPASQYAETVKNRQYMTLVNGDYYYIYSDPVGSPDFNKFIYSFSESQAPGIEPNQIYSFSDAFGYHHKILIVKSGDRVYTFQTVSSTKDNASAKRFFAGIKIKGMKLQANEIEALQNIPTGNSQLGFSCNPPLPPAPTSKPAGSGISNGIEGVSGVSSEALVALPTPTPAQTTPIKIITKPRPNYTDTARFYHTTGTVSLRVTFRADGKMSAVSIVKRLPFGITEQAISAACQMQFEPATRNGVPYTVTKVVQYNFVLY
jgi:TonB family protein